MSTDTTPAAVSLQVVDAGGLLGRAVLHEPRIVVKQLIAEDIKVEMERLTPLLAPCVNRSTF